MLQRQVLIFVCIAHLLFTATHNMPEIEAIPSHIPNRKRFKLKIQGNTPTANIITPTMFRPWLFLSLVSPSLANKMFLPLGVNVTTNMLQLVILPGTHDLLKLGPVHASIAIDIQRGYDS